MGGKIRTVSQNALHRPVRKTQNNPQHTDNMQSFCTDRKYRGHIRKLVGVEVYRRYAKNQYWVSLMSKCDL
jgi:hypothetical protein